MKSNQVKSKKTKTETAPELETTETSIPKEKKATKAKKTSAKKTNLEGKLSDIPLKEKKAPKAKEKLTISPETKKVLKEIISLLKEKKCEDIVVMNLEEVNSYLSLFVIATVASHTQGRAAVELQHVDTKVLNHVLGTLQSVVLKEVKCRYNSHGRLGTRL